MYGKLATAGLNREVVDNYLAGVRGELGIESEQPVLSDAEVNDLKNMAGGERGYEQLMNWAGNNLTQQDAKNYDDVLATGNKAAISFAIKALLGQYEDANGRDSNIVTGKQTSTEN